MRVYQAGPIDNVPDYGLGWRNRLKEDYPEIEWIDPSEKELERLDEGAAIEDRLEMWEPEEMVEADYEQIASSDALLVHYERVPSTGTPMEVAVTDVVPPLARTIRAMASYIASMDGGTDEGTARTIMYSHDVPEWLADMVLAIDHDVPIVVQTTVEDPSFFMQAHSDVIVETFAEAVRELEERA